MAIEDLLIKRKNARIDPKRASYGVTPAGRKEVEESADGYHWGVKLEILECVSEHGPIRVPDIVKETGKDPVQVREVMKKLVEQGLIRQMQD